MAKKELIFWLISGSGILSFFFGAVIGIIFYPTFKQLLGMHAKYGSASIFLLSGLCFFYFTRWIVLALLKKDE